MPTEPYKPILDRDLTKIKPFSDKISPVLQEVINYATQFYQRCQISKECKGDETYPVLALYLHIIQMADSIEVLISNGCSEPANLLLRSSFEAKLSISYILEKNVSQRSISWMVKNIIDQIKQLERHDPSSPKYKEFKETLSQDKLGNIDEFQKIPDISERITKLKEALTKPDYAEAYAEYQALRKRNRGVHPEWYSLFDGPKNLRELAKYFKQGLVYETLYAYWSRISHVSDALHLTMPLEDGDSVLGPIRNPINSINIGTTILSQLIESIQLLMMKYRPYESNKFYKWWRTDIRERHFELMGLSIGQLNWFDKTFIQKK
jgi:hypothetical protein